MWGVVIGVGVSVGVVIGVVVGAGVARAAWCEPGCEDTLVRTTWLYLGDTKVITVN